MLNFGLTLDEKNIYNQYSDTFNLYYPNSNYLQDSKTYKYTTTSSLDRGGALEQAKNIFSGQIKPGYKLNILENNKTTPWTIE